MGMRVTMGRGHYVGGTIMGATVKVGVPGQHESILVHCKVKGHYMGVGASYRLTRDPCSTRLTLWETQMGEGSPSV